MFSNLQRKMRIRGFRVSAKNSVLQGVCVAVYVLAVSAALPVVAIPSQAFALQEPRPISTDRRIRTVRYSPNEVYQFVGHYGYQSSIEFSEDEKVQTVSIGDSVAWMVNPAENRLFLKPIEQNATTNLTVITDKRTYFFELHAEETSNIRDDEMIFTVRFVYPQNDSAALEFTQFEAMPDIEAYPERYNFNYSVRGADSISPVRIFDDGNFTYFEFRDLNAELPAIFHVDSAGNEELVNFRKRGNYVVVERVSPVFTLRRGPDLMCVYNEAVPIPSKPVPEEKGWIDRVFN
jgi:type IV secretion system protein VirB9